MTSEKGPDEIMDDLKRTTIEGRGIPLRGNDIDTDRILPARYMKSVVFDGLGEHAFQDDRTAQRAAGRQHPFDDPRFSQGTILLVNKNFGCGSSREHAPQALSRRRPGIQAVVGESFGEIFRGNCVALGIPCVVVDGGNIGSLLSAVEAEPTLELRLDLRTRSLTAGGREVRLSIDDGARAQFIEGRWDSTSELLASKHRILETARAIPYFRHYS
jgi:3-isopropylmalate/(R)-2-methylmalate dehydratase small subunit